MPRLGLNKLRQQTAVAGPRGLAIGRKHLSELVVVDDHAIAWGVGPPPFLTTQDGRRDAVLNRPALRRINRAINRDSSKARREAARVARRNATRPHARNLVKRNRWRNQKRSRRF
jgi:hypothetical protein